jgi:hypothetical protein
MRRILAPCLCLAVLGSAGCDRPGPSSDQTAVRDSAGIRIVEFAPQPAGAAWTVASQPALSIGSLDGPAETQLGRVTGVVRLRDGTIVVADDAAPALRFFDRDGRHLRSVGRRGSGPGEFEQIGGLWRFAGDSLAVWDLRQSRLSIFSPAGELVRTALPRPGPPGAFAPMHGVFSDGSFVLGSGMNMGEIFAGGSRRFRDTVVLVRYGAEGRALDTIGRFPGDERDAEVAGTGFSLNPVPFGRRTFIAVSGRHGYVVAGDAQVAVLEPGGRRSSILRQRSAPSPVTPEDISAFRQGTLAAASPGDRPGVETRLRSLRYPETKAPFAGLEVDDHDRAWLRVQDVPDGRASRWMVLSPTGELLARVELPPGFVLHQVDEDGVLGVSRGASDEPYVQFYPLSRE